MIGATLNYYEIRKQLGARGIGTQKSEWEFNMAKRLLLICFFSLAPLTGFYVSAARAQTVSILLVRHAEADQSRPHRPLNEAGRQRAAVFTDTIRDVRFTHIFATHTVRALEMVEATAKAQGLQVVQLPRPGSTFDGEIVTDQTSRRAPIELISQALLRLPPGSRALVAGNSENLFAIMNKLGVPLPESGKTCQVGSMCVPCTDNSCYPRMEFDHF